MVNATQSQLPFDTQDLTPVIGTQLKTDKATLLSSDCGEALRNLLRQRGVLFIRGGHFSDDEQMQFSKKLGDVQMAGNDGLQNISLDLKVSIAAEYLKGSVYWHIDGATDDIPNFAATLNPRKLSDIGGTTYFANTYAAYDALPDDEKEQYADLKVVHSLEAAQLMFNPEPTYKEVEMWQTMRPQKVHPLVWTHKTGRKSLILGGTSDYIEGMDVAKGRAILCKLREWCTQDQFVYSHEWEMGDLLVWDNTGTMHRVDQYPLDSGRLLVRTTINGEYGIA